MLDDMDGDRRGFLKCMAWAGTGVLWTVNGGVLSSRLLGQTTAPALSGTSTNDLYFIQISDSHIGFKKPANQDVVGTFRETISRINALPQTPEFILHTGDLTHLAEAGEFDTLEQVLKDCRTKQVFYVPGEHDILNDNGAQYRERFGKGSKRQRRIGIVALARKLLVALWRYLEYAELPEGALEVAWQSKIAGAPAMA